MVKRTVIGLVLLAAGAGASLLLRRVLRTEGRGFLEKSSDKRQENPEKSPEKHKEVSETVGKPVKEIKNRRISPRKTSGKILAAVGENGDLTISDLALLIGVSERSIERNIRKLKAGGVLKRVGGRKEGHWEVV